MTARWRYEDLPDAVRARVDAIDRAGRQPAEPASDAVAVRRRRPGRQPNKTETAYRGEVLARRQGVAAVHYEGITFRMANGHRYTPDWIVVTAAGRVECHEVKGGYALHSQQRARLAFDQARVEFPCFVWVWAVRNGRAWVVSGV
jgi:hypothetical protein